MLQTWRRHARPACNYGLLVAILIAGCLLRPAAAAGAGALDCPASSPAATPATAALLQDPAVAAAVAALPDRIEAIRTAAGVVGLSVAVVHDQEVLFAGGFG